MKDKSFKLRNSRFKPTTVDVAQIHAERNKFNMLTSKQRAQLRALANPLETIIHIGKGGITDNLIKQADDALRARELIKGRVMDNCELTAREAADQLAERCGAESVQAIGSRFSLYRENREIDKDKRIKLVK